jgi:hypothetical protein
VTLRGSVNAAARPTRIALNRFRLTATGFHLVPQGK